MTSARSGCLLGCAIVALLALDRRIDAHEGDLDPSFNGSGKLVFSIDPAALINTAYAVAIDAEGRIVSRARSADRIRTKHAGASRGSTMRAASIRRSAAAARSRLRSAAVSNRLFRMRSRSRTIVQRRAWSATRQSLDPAFASGGTATIDFDQDGNLSESAATGAAFDAQGRVVIVGYSSIDGSGTQNMAIARLQGERIFRDGFDGS